MYYERLARTGIYGDCSLHCDVGLVQSYGEDILYFLDIKTLIDIDRLLGPDIIERTRGSHERTFLLTASSDECSHKQGVVQMRAGCD